MPRYWILLFTNALGMRSGNMEAIAFVLGPCQAILLVSCGRMIKSIIHQQVVSPPTIPTNLTTQITSVNGEGQGPFLAPLVDPIGQQLANTARTGGLCMGDDDDLISCFLWFAVWACARYVPKIYLSYDTFSEFSINNSIHFQFICEQWSNFVHSYHDGKPELGLKWDIRRIFIFYRICEYLHLEWIIGSLCVMAAQID